MNISISVGDLAAISRGLREAPEVTNRFLTEAMTEATLLVEREWKEKVPKVSSLTAGSIISDVASTPVGVLGVVGSSQASALFLELGTKAHMPPVEALVPWVKAVLGITEPKEAKSVAFLVARKIARDGTEAKRPLERAVDATQAQIVAMFERASERIVNHLGSLA